MTQEEERILGDLQERNAILQQCLEDIEEATTIEQATTEAQQCLDALSVVQYVTPHVPMWIGIEIPTNFGYYRLCLGVNQEGGDSVSFCNETDIQNHENDIKNIPSPWNNEGLIVVSYGVDERVFNNEHNFI